MKVTYDELRRDRDSLQELLFSIIYDFAYRTLTRVSSHLYDLRDDGDISNEAFCDARNIVYLALQDIKRMREV